MRWRQVRRGEGLGSVPQVFPASRAGLNSSPPVRVKPARVGRDSPRTGGRRRGGRGGEGGREGKEGGNLRKDVR